MVAENPAFVSTNIVFEREAFKEECKKLHKQIIKVREGAALYYIELPPDAIMGGMYSAFYDDGALENVSFDFLFENPGFTSAYRSQNEDWLKKTLPQKTHEVAESGIR